MEGYDDGSSNVKRVVDARTGPAAGNAVPAAGGSRAEAPLMPGMERLARDIAADAAATEYDCGWRFGPGQRPIRVSVRAIEGGWEAYAFYVREDRDIELVLRPF